MLKLVAVVLWLLCSTAMPAQTRVDSDIGLTGIRVQAASVVDADAAVLWATLTDYNNIAKFVPGMSVSRELTSNKPGIRLVEQIGKDSLLSLVLPDHVILEVHEKPKTTIGFRAVSGKVLSMQGEWVIHGISQPVTLLYRVRVIPVLPPPPALTDWYVEDEIRVRMNAVAAEAERRMKNK